MAHLPLQVGRGIRGHGAYPVVVDSRKQKLTRERDRRSIISFLFSDAPIRFTPPQVRAMIPHIFSLLNGRNMVLARGEFAPSCWHYICCKCMLIGERNQKRMQSSVPMRMTSGSLCCPLPLPCPAQGTVTFPNCFSREVTWPKRNSCHLPESVTGGAFSQNAPR